MEVSYRDYLLELALSSSEWSTLVSCVFSVDSFSLGSKCSLYGSSFRSSGSELVSIREACLSFIVLAPPVFRVRICTLPVFDGAVGDFTRFLRLQSGDERCLPWPTFTIQLWPAFRMLLYHWFRKCFRKWISTDPFQFYGHDCETCSTLSFSTRGLFFSHSSFTSLVSFEDFLIRGPRGLVLLSLWLRFRRSC